MAKRNSSESSGRRGRTSSSRSSSGKSSPGKGKSSDKSYKKFDKGDSRSSGSPRAERPYKKFDKPSSSKPTFRKTDEGSDQRKKPFSRPSTGESSGRPYKKFDKPFGKSSSRGNDQPSERKSPRSFGPAKGESSDRPYKKFDRPFDKSSSRGEDNTSDKREPRSFRASGSSAKPYKKFDKPFDKPSTRRGDDSSEKRYARPSSPDKPFKKTDKPHGKSRGNDDSAEGKASGDKPRSASFGLPFKRAYDKPSAPGRERSSDEKGDKPFVYPRKFKRSSPDEAPHLDTDIIRLNRYIANSGLCSRREADEFIKMGLVTVNGNVITELGHKVKRSDEVRYEDKVLKAEKPVYILMNKPKGYLTTTKDPQERNTVMHILEGKVKERVYPVGRLDRNTTGLLLLTNDGDLADKLMHPSYKAKKIYKVELDRVLTKADFQKIRDGVYLEEGRAVVDDLAIVGDDGKTIGIELHIGWNRVVRRIFEALGYDVVKLDRSVYAGLDKKDLPRGHWRALKQEEIVMLKHYKK